eukprot:364234-Chlamydomonas_euryale.AAC.17
MHMRPCVEHAGFRCCVIGTRRGRKHETRGKDQTRPSIAHCRDAFRCGTARSAACAAARAVPATCEALSCLPCLRVATTPDFMHPSTPPRHLRRVERTRRAAADAQRSSLHVAGVAVASTLEHARPQARGELVERRRRAGVQRASKCLCYGVRPHGNRRRHGGCAGNPQCPTRRAAATQEDGGSASVVQQRGRAGAAEGLRTGAARGNLPAVGGLTGQALERLVACARALPGHLCPITGGGHAHATARSVDSCQWDVAISNHRMLSMA